MTERRCDSCLHWIRDPESFPGEPEGQCHRHAPRPTVLTKAAVFWPPTFAVEFCGEWQPKPVRQTAEQCPECVRLRTQLGRL